ncbi:MAG TPA: DUF4350 domain-containing protein [Pyrinomonadaceae bacterium]|jgi:hypothetical protein|nr:DUF4350 domain-containing protein [Pyrinomonadaceae bacterium]
MKARLLIFLTVVLMVVLLVALNAASYVRVEQEGDTELLPDRSTLNAGGTGALALFEYLQQKGVDVVRWRQPMSALLAEDEAARPASLVVVGKLRHAFEKREADAVLRWVEGGGRLVLVDRSPDPKLLPTAAGGWRVGSELFEYPGPEVRTDDAELMTRGVPLLSPAQPTALTRDVAEVARSRFAGRLHVYQTNVNPPAARGANPRGPRSNNTPTPTPEADGGLFGGEASAPAPPAPAPAPRPSASDAQEVGESSAPVVHLKDGREGEGALLVDYAYGRGRVVVLSDPYIVSNGGINRADNLFLAAGVVTGGRAGRVAFDEFHQGYGATENEFFAYFRGTPVLWLFAQTLMLVVALVWTRGRRFARAIPAPRADRRSKLEFVASMAELQQRARAYDLAVENIYQRTRRALARYGGVGANAPLEQVAARVAARSGRDPKELEALLRECEDSIAGAPLTARRALSLARSLRELERDLGILMRAREIRQAR